MSGEIVGHGESGNDVAAGSATGDQYAEFVQEIPFREQCKFMEFLFEPVLIASL